jgi:hypothetical protein
MNTIVAPGVPQDDVSRFPSLAALRAAHGDMLRLHDDSGETDGFLDQVDTFIRQGRATGTLLDAHGDRWAAQSLLDYWATILYRAGREPPVGSLAEFDPLEAPDLPDSLCPYVGLDAFDESKRGFFFGRRRFIDEWGARLKDSRMLAIVGTAGSGRSSLVLGGLLPALRDGGVPGSQHWRYYPPMVPGPDPLASLARLFQPGGTDAADWIERQVAALQHDPSSLARLAGEVDDEPAVLIVEQFEELFTLCADEQAREAFVDNLVGLIQAPGARHTVILTMLSDLERRVEHLSTFRHHFEQAEVRLTPPSAGELRDAIEQPARLVGLKFDEGVVDELVQDICGEVAALPLLQFSLLKLWEHRERDRVTWAAYRHVGGGRRALERSADDFFQQLSSEDQELAKRIVLRMVPPTDGLEGAGTRVRRQVLYGATEDRPRVDSVVRMLVDAHLVRAIGDPTDPDAQVELAHEALTKCWPTLASWLDDQKVAIVARRRLEARAADWRRLGSGRAGLLDAGQVFEAERWLATPEATYVGYDDRVQEFVRASREAVNADEQKRRGIERARRMGISLVVASIIVAIFVTLWYQRELSDQKAVAAATAQTLEAEKSAASEKQARLALARQQAQQAVAAALRRFDDRVDVSMLLVLEAGRLAALGEDRENVLIQGALLDGLLSKTRLATFLHGHTAAVGALAFSPDRKILASGDANGVIILHDVLSDQVTSQPLRQSTDVRGLAFSPDSTVLVSVGTDGMLTLWDVAAGQAVGSLLAGGDQSVVSVAFSSDGNLLASGSPNGTIILWDIGTREQIGSLLAGPAGPVQSVAFSSDGNLLASGSPNGTIVLWDVGTRQPLGSPFNGRSGLVQSKAFSRDGTSLASGTSTGRIILWDVATRQQLGMQLTGHTGLVQSVAFSPDGKKLASGSSRT